MGTTFPNQAQTTRAWQATRLALGLAQDASLTDGELSVFFKHLLVHGLQSHASGWESNLPALRSHLESRLGALRVALRLDYDAVKDSRFDRVQARSTLHSSSFYPRRLIDLALASLASANLAPEICLELQAWSAHDLAAVLHGKRYHVVVFADAVLFQHEFYPLAVDAYVHDALLGAMRTNVVGAHVDWLCPDGSPKRIVFLDADRDRLREADLLSPIRPDSAQFHSLGKNEQSLHQQWSAALPCVQLNPYVPSSLADDKAATLAGWVELGIEVPAFAKLAAGDVEGAWRFLKTHGEVVVKPNQSTEGDGVAYFEFGQDRHAEAFALHLESCWHQGDALAQQRRDGLLFRDSHNGTWHNLSLRLNLAFDGHRYQVESGYAQLAADTSHAASRSLGGRIVSLLEILDGLFPRTDQDGTKISLTTSDWIRLCGQATLAASLFNGLLLLGLDVLLDLDADGRILPVFLEANPRPAGLCHSHLLDTYPDGSCPPSNGVSLRLWDGLDSLM